MRSTALKSVFLLSALVLVAVPVAFGDIVTFDFTGIVRSSGLTSVPVDSPVSGHYSFDSDLSSPEVTPPVANYRFSPPGTLQFTTGTSVFNCDLSQITLLDYTEDLYFVGENGRGAILLRGPSTALSGLALPLVPPNVSAFTSSRWFGFPVALDSGEVWVEGDITSITSQAVPEPSLAILLALVSAPPASPRGAGRIRGGATCRPAFDAVQKWYRRLPKPLLKDIPSRII